MIRLLKRDCLAKYPTSYSFGLTAAANEIAKLDTADVVEVVRCRNCKYLTKDQIADEIIDRCVCFGGMIDIVPDGFCSYGERREE